MFAAFAHEFFARDIFVVLVVALHREDVEIRPAVAIEVDRARIAGPTVVDESHRFRDFLEFAVAEIVIEQAALVVLVFEVVEEGYFEAAVITVRGDLVRRVGADIADKQIQQSVTVVVEKNGT